MAWHGVKFKYESYRNLFLLPSLQQICLGAHQIVPDGLEVQPTDVFAADVFAAVAGAVYVTNDPEPDPVTKPSTKQPNKKQGKKSQSKKSG